MSEPQAAAARAVEAKSEGLKFTLEQMPTHRPSIKVIGIGGCGGNVIDHMIESGVTGVEMVCLNTDEQALIRCKAETKVQLGQRMTQGYGTGADPEVGREAALQNTEELTELLGDADMVFLVAGLGGGTGTGAAPVVASLAKQMGALTVAAAIKPFVFEGKRRTAIAEKGMAALLEQADTALAVPNARLLEHVESGRGFFDAFRVADNVVLRALEGITDVISKPGIMNSDFADVRMVLQGAGLAVIGSAERSGRDAATQAAREAIASPMMEHTGLDQATKILVNITGSKQFGMQDASEALQLIHREVQADADLVVGAVRDDEVGESVKVVVIASGFEPRQRHAEEVASVAADPALGVSGGIASSAPSAGREAYGRVQVPWGSERAVELVESDEAEAPAVAEAAQEKWADGSEAGPSGAGRDKPPARPDGRPLEFMPPPNIRPGDGEEESVTRRKPAFFRRRSRSG